MVAKNECGSTPLWRKEEQVVNLREKDYKAFMSRREGQYFMGYAASTTPRMSPPTIRTSSSSVARTPTNLKNWHDCPQIQIAYRILYIVKERKERKERKMGVLSLLFFLERGLSGL